MPDTPSRSSGSQQSAPKPLPAYGRISQLKPPGELDFDASDLFHKWKKLSEEIRLYMDLVMEGHEEKLKVKLFLYVIGSKGWETYETIHFARAPNDRTLEDVMRAFEERCNPKKNETMERYRFFSKAQKESESVEKFITD